MIRELRVISKVTGEVVKRVSVSGRSEVEVEKILSGLLRNLNRETYRVEDSQDDTGGFNK